MKLVDFPIEELREYKPTSTMEDDFNMFWDNRIKESNKQPLNIYKKLNKEFNYTSNVKVYDVEFDGFRNTKIKCMYVTPNVVQKDAPGVIMFHGYNYNNLKPNNAFKYTVQGIPVLMLSTRGQSVNSPDHNLYENGGAAGWLTKGIVNKDNYYYSYVYMDCFRAVEALVEFDSINPNKIILDGASQGGGLALATAALNNRVKIVLSDIPFLCNFKRSVEVSDGNPYDEISQYFKLQDPLHETENEVYRVLSYVDCVNMATRIKCPTLLSVGLEDNVCPPSGAFAAYNNMTCIKDIKVYPNYAHGGFNQQEEEKLKFINKYI